MICLQIIADRRSTAEDIAGLLSFEDRIQVVESTVVSSASFQAVTTVDVLLAVKLQAAQLPHASLPVVVLSEDRGSPSAGVHAWLPLHASPQAVTAAIISAAADLYSLTAEQLHLAPADELDLMRVEKLTARELQVLNLISEGLANKQIAAALRISDHTAKFHVAQVLAKLRAGSRTEAVRIGIQRGLVAL